jgi:hypothetical protein
VPIAAACSRCADEANGEPFPDDSSVHGDEQPCPDGTLSGGVAEGGRAVAPAAEGVGATYDPTGEVACGVLAK